ncbi:MAG TPA: hypothetical protein PLE19_13475 [Planctomycetota bacterium]|nr:hypothetical protein [Planctomycetota bacterium]HRR80826.1 hypothetical protein [Planctomycetota bacterium]HRT97197.1 hypothetical protein [Planctomycetota bacterium]
MATRRIARGRGGSPVPIIVLTVLVVGLIGSTVVLGLSVGDLEKKLVVTEDRLKEKTAEGQKAQNRFREYERLIGFTLEGAEREFTTLKEELLKKAPLPALADVEGPAAKAFVDLKTLVAGYADRCAGLEKVVAGLERELATAKEQRETALRDGAEAAKTKDKQIKVEQEAVAKVREDLAKVEKERDEIRERLTAEVEELKTRATKLTKDLASAEKSIRVLEEQRKKDAEVIKDLQFPKKKLEALVSGTGAEPADGKILTADADGQHVMVDVGRKDWVEVGMFFSVFEKGDEDGRREKGQIQIRQVMDQISRAKVIKQDELDPILPGMLIVNPAFKRGTKLEFRLKGRFLEPRIEQMLSRYPCTLAEKVSMTTDYVIVGDAKPDESRGEVPWDEDEEVLFAKENKITIMREREILHYLGER